MQEFKKNRVVIMCRRMACVSLIYSSFNILFFLYFCRSIRILTQKKLLIKLEL